MSELETLVASTALPDQLKEYFTASKYIQELLTKEILNDIEDLYVYYDSLYLFDTSYFGACVIDSLKRCKDFNMYYFYLRKILENKLEIVTKEDDTYIKLHKDYIDELFKKTSIEIIDQLTLNKDVNKNLINFHLGKLDLIIELTEDNYHLDIYQKVKRLVGI